MSSSSSSAASSSSSSSPSPPPQKSKDKKQQQQQKSRKADKKGKKKSTEAGNANNVGTSWEFEPPEGAVLINTNDEDAGEFDWDAIKNDDNLELWLIRVPESIKPKHLQNFTIDLPSSSSSSCLGSLKRKYMTFDLWSVSDDDPKLPVGGEELKNISCLLPRKSKNGKLYPAPKPFAHHLVLAAQPVKPTPPSADDAIATFKTPPRYSYPKEFLKHRFMPCGALAKIQQTMEVEMDLDEDKEKEKDKEVVKSPPSPKKTKERDTVDVEVKKGKKRKVDVVIDVTQSPGKKTKKVKVA